MACSSKIANNIARDCNNPPVAGLEIDIYLYNRDDVDTYTYTGSNPLLIEGITMKAGKKMYKWTGYKTSNIVTCQFRKREMSDGFLHQIDLLVFKNTVDAKQEIENLKASTLGCIYVNKWKGANNQDEFELLGREVGLEMSAGERKTNDAATQSAWKITLSSPADQDEGHTPATVFKTSKTATLAMITAITYSPS